MTMTAADPDRAALDAQYNLRAAVPAFQDYFDRYDARSAAFSARGRARLDCAYGDSGRQAIDLFLPEARHPPVLVFIHGGYWHSQDRRRFAFVAEPLVAAGAAVALLGYDLVPAVDMDALVAQIRRGLGWLWRTGPDLGIDRDRLHLAGHSAGGHLTAMALATDWPAEGLPADLIKGACPISGIFDLEPIRRCYLNDVLGLDEAAARRNSPIHLPPRARCPVVVAVGAGETAAFLEQSRRYVDHLRSCGVDATLLVQPEVDHFAIIDAIGSGASPVVGALCRLMALPAAGSGATEARFALDCTPR